MLIDTDVLIWHLRGHPSALQTLDALPEPPMLSAVTYLELLQGLRNKAEMQALKKMLLQRRMTVLPITEAITGRAIDLVESLVLSHSLQMGDGLIAATALLHEVPVLTANFKHFSAVPNLQIVRFVV
ncbi:MAG: hypothetical protein RLZZ373_3943 [Pseudomonadota bacterium]|jgi:predicted nucleic acid-binding protein